MSWWLARNKSSESEAEKEEQGSDIDSVHPAAASLLELQRASGNQAVQRRIAGHRRDAESLEPEIQEQLESRFGEDLSMIRLHTDSDAAKSSEALNAKAYTKGRDIYFSAGSYAPNTSEGQRLLTHEVAHAIQQGKEKATGRLGVSPASESAEGEAQRAAGSRAQFNVGVREGPRVARDAPVKAVSETAKSVAAAVDKFDPEASGGIGDYTEAFRILAGLPTPQLLTTLVELDDLFKLDSLKDYIRAAINGRDRIELAILAVRLRSKGLGATDLARGQSLASSLDPAEQNSVMSFLGHAGNVKLFGADKELGRLVELQTQSWEQKRKQQEDEARKAQEEAAKKTGSPAPVVAPTTTTLEVVTKDVESRVKPLQPTKEWDDLSDATKKDWTDKRAPAAWNKVVASVKGSELEKVMTGKSFRFEPREAIEQFFYAKQDGTTLVFGMLWVKDAEANAKNVWPNVVHELGAHFEYGETYASKIMNKVLDRLPEAERNKIRGDKETWRKFYLAYAYSETEIYAALRQRRYDNPESGTKPVHHAIQPDDNIKNHLTKIKEGFPAEVALAILLELKQRVDASPEILTRDKNFFTDQVKAIVGVTL